MLYQYCRVTEDFITEDFGVEGTPTRMEFDADVDAFILGERLKEERQKAGLTQEQLADKIGIRRAISHELRTDILIFRSLHSSRYSKD